MKKSVVILIALIYIAAIALVSFFGLQFKVFEEVVPVDSIEITNEGQKYSPSQGDYIILFPNEKGERRLKIDYRINPDNASNTEVDFAYEKKDVASVDEYGVVTFTGPGMLKVTIIAQDGSNAEDSILIISP